MSKRLAFWLAWFTWVLYLIIASINLFLDSKDAPSSAWLDNLFGVLMLLAFATVGSLIASRRPQIRLAGSSVSVRCCGPSADFCRNTQSTLSLQFLVRSQQEY